MDGTKKIRRLEKQIDFLLQKIYKLQNQVDLIKCTKRNPQPPCGDGYYERLNPLGKTCCYKIRKKKQ